MGRSRIGSYLAQHKPSGVLELSGTERDLISQIKAADGEGWQRSRCVICVPTAHRVEVKSGTNSRGQTYGSGDTESAQPDLVAVITNGGQIGYVPSGDLAGPALTLDEVKQLPVETSNGQQVRSAPARTVTAYAEDGVTAVGDFTIR